MPIQPRGKQEFEDAEIHAHQVARLKRVMIPLFWVLILGGILVCGVVLYYLIQLIASV